MFDRRLFKSNAKMMLKRYYWQAFLAVLAVFGLSAVVSLLAIDYDLAGVFRAYGEMISALARQDYDNAQQATAALQAATVPGEFSMTFDALQLGFTFLIMPVLTVGLARFFLHSRENRADVKELLTPFKKNFGSNLGTMILRDFYIWLWTFIPVMIAIFVIFLPLMLFVSFASIDYSSGEGVVILLFSVLAMYFAVILIGTIPATIKGLEYSMLPYILAENQKIGYKRAFELTKAMTRGYKWKLFILELSFLGWRMLALIVPFGNYFLLPYTNAVLAEAYTCLKARALEQGLASPEDFPGLREKPAEPAVTENSAPQLNEAEEAVQAAETAAEEAVQTAETTAEEAIQTAETAAEEIAEPVQTTDSIEMPTVADIPEIAAMPEVNPIDAEPSADA